MNANEKAERAQAIIDDPVFREALHDLRMNLVAQLEGTAISDVETQHEVALMLMLLRKIPAQLQNYINNAKMKQATEKERTFIERIRERYG